MAARLKETYVNEVAPALMKKFEYKSVMQIPKLDKIVINVACGEARDNPKVVDAIVSDLSQITGQKPVLCKAKKSVANFKLREGMTIGVKVTLRGSRMYEFLDRFFNLALPRVLASCISSVEKYSCHLSVLPSIGYHTARITKRLSALEYAFSP